MPLTSRAPVAELNRSNCVAVMLGSFRRNPAVKGLIFMPGATDEFYFFRRARARLTNSAPTLLDAVAALTNQTYIRATVRAPFLLLHTAQDPLEPIELVLDQKAADAVRRHKFAKAALYNDRDWDYLQHLLGFYLNTTMIPKPRLAQIESFLPQQFRRLRPERLGGAGGVGAGGENEIYSQEGSNCFRGGRAGFGSGAHGWVFRCAASLKGSGRMESGCGRDGRGQKGPRRRECHGGGWML